MVNRLMKVANSTVWACFLTQSWLVNSETNLGLGGYFSITKGIRTCLNMSSERHCG